MGVIQIRDFETHSDYEQCVDLQKEIWTFPDRDLIPAIELLVVHRHGGVCIGAFDEGSMVGFVCGMVAWRDEWVFHHSHMVAVRPDYRGRRIGEKLKWAQRDRVLNQGLDFIDWTFDPLQAANANFNINRLGVMIKKYSVNVYGETVSPLHGGLPTDRFEAEWLIRSSRVIEARKGKRPQLPGWRELARANRVQIQDGLPHCKDIELGLDARELLVEIPSDVARIMAKDHELAREWRLDTRRLFQHYLGRGYAVEGFHLSDSGAYYRLMRES